MDRMRERTEVGKKEKAKECKIKEVTQPPGKTP
jgi:hypothetical protein